MISASVHILHKINLLLPVKIILQGLGLTQKFFSATASVLMERERRGDTLRGEEEDGGVWILVKKSPKLIGSLHSGSPLTICPDFLLH